LNASVSTSWLSVSQVGASLQALLPAAYRERHCHLCDLPFDAINRSVPCLHWCISPYCKADRLAAVFDAFGTVDVIRYLYLCMDIHRRARTRVQPCEPVFSWPGDGRTEATIRYRNHVWVFEIGADGCGTVELRHRVSGPRFALPLQLAADEMQMLAELAAAAGVAEPLATAP
jgi:hypothetical protein